MWWFQKCKGVFRQMSGNDNYLFPSSGLSIDHMIFFSVILIFDFHFHLRSQWDIIYPSHLDISLHILSSVLYIS